MTHCSQHTIGFSPFNWWLAQDINLCGFWTMTLIKWKKLKAFSKGMMKELFVKNDKNFYNRFIEIRDKHFCFSGNFFLFLCLTFLSRYFSYFCVFSDRIRKSNYTWSIEILALKVRARRSGMALDSIRLSQKQWLKGLFIICNWTMMKEELFLLICKIFNMNHDVRIFDISC